MSTLPTPSSAAIFQQKLPPIFVRLHRGRHPPPLPRSKIFKKSEKKACQPRKSPLIATPNLTKHMEKLMIRNVFKTLGSVRAALVVAIGIPFFIALSAYAQNPGAPPTGPGAGAPAAAGATAPGPATAEAERVIVTGSNIPTAEEVGPNPVFALNRDLIGKSGQGTVEQRLKTQPVMGASSVPVQNNSTGQAGPAGTASISLRGFDPGASLTLVDGRRVAPFPGAANSGAGF